MKICLGHSFSAQQARAERIRVSHLARELRRDPLLSLTILADELDAPGEELPELRCGPLLAL